MVTSSHGAILETGRPVVVSEPVPPGMPEPTATVAGDHVAAMNQLLDRLWTGGATSSRSSGPSDPDVGAYRSGRSRGLGGRQPRPSHVRRPHGCAVGRGTPSDDPGLRATHPDVDAIVCLPEGLGVGILSTLRELGHSVPDDIQLVSYTDSPSLAIVQPPISALDLRARTPACGPENC